MVDDIEQPLDELDLPGDELEEPSGEQGSDVEELGGKQCVVGTPVSELGNSACELSDASFDELDASEPDELGDGGSCGDDVRKPDESRNVEETVDATKVLDKEEPDDEVSLPTPSS